MLSQGSEPIRAPACSSLAPDGLLGDEDDLLSMNLFHLSGNKLDNELPGSSFHWGAFHFEIDGLSRWHCPRKFKGTQSANRCYRENPHCMRNQAGIQFQCGSREVPVLQGQ